MNPELPDGAKPDPPTASWSGERLRVELENEPLCEEFEVAWRAGGKPSIEEFLERVGPAVRPGLLRALLKLDLHYRGKPRDHRTLEEYRIRFPNDVLLLQELIAHPTPSSQGDRLASPDWSVGQIIAGRYQIVKKRAKGGMGEVYEATDLELSQVVALKFLPWERASDQKWIDRLKEEVRLARSVTHENVCRVHSLEFADGQPFLVMEYANDGTLAKLVGSLNQDRVVAYGRQLCDGLEAIHAKSLLHRDLKPANILIDNDRALIADLGLAAVAGTIDPSQVGAGTLAYMAPEQLDGREVTRRSDLFALGLVLYELTTGRRPFPGKSRDELLRLYRQAPEAPSVRVPGLDPALDRVILRCLQFNPKERPASAREVRDALPPLSPEITTKQGGTGRLRPALALWLLGAAVVGIILHALLADRVMAFRQAPVGEDPDNLKQTARKIAVDFGYPKDPKSEAYMLEWDLDLVNTLVAEPSRWRNVTDGYTPAMYFWYRRSPTRLVPGSRMTPADPPPIVPGMVCVMLDSSGKLIEFHAVPNRSPTTTDVDSQSWEGRLFAAAGLAREQFGEDNARARRPPVHADKFWSLREKAVEGSSRPLRDVDIAICDGKPVYFRVSERLAGDKPARDRLEIIAGLTDEVSPHDSTNAGTLTLILIILVGGTMLAIRNWRLQRIDWQGSVKVPLICLTLILLGRIAATSRVWSLEGERSIFMNGLGVAGFWALILGVSYLALEPYMRRRWPERLSSWNRLLVGRFCDPLVGRDVLVGVIAGICFAFATKLNALLLTWSGQPTYCLTTPYYNPFTPAVPGGTLIQLLATAMIRIVCQFVLLLFAGLLFRRESLAALALVVFLMAYNYSVAISPDWTTPIGITLSAILVVLLMIRFGLLASLIGLYIAMILTSMPLTIDFSTWYVGGMLLTYAVLTAFTLYGFFVSLDGQRIIPD